MWLSQRTAAHAGSEGAAGGALVGTVTIGGEKNAVLLSGEHRAIPVAAPQGLAWQPKTGTQVLVVETGDGERFLIGAVAEGGGIPEDGELSSAGTLRHAGNVYITGRLFLNGKEVTVKEEN